MPTSSTGKQTPKRREKKRGPKFDLSGSTYMKNLLIGIRRIHQQATQPPTTKTEATTK
jgi:hypothetical protein